MYKSMLTTKRFKSIAILFLLALFSTYVNWIPEGHVVATGDVMFQPNLINTYYNYFYTWGHIAGYGYNTVIDISGIFHFGILSLLALMGLSNSQIQNVLYFSFLFLSGISMYFSFNILTKFKASETALLLISLYYMFNTFTIEAFVTIGGYLPYFNVYIYVPLIWSILIRGVLDKKTNYIIYSSFVFLFAINSFSNPAFLIALFVFLGISLGLLWLMKMIDFKEFASFLSFFPLCLLLISFFSLPLLDMTINADVPETLKNTETLKQWLSWQSLPPLHVFQLIRINIYPTDFPYSDLLPRSLFVIMSFYPIILVMLSLLFVKKKEYKIWGFLSGLLSLILVFGSSKTILSEDISYFLFTKPVLNLLRSPDKFLVFLPFSFALSIGCFIEQLMQNIRNKRIKIYTFCIIFVIILAYPLPFFIGTFHETVSFNKVWDYKYSVMVEEPHYYKELAEYVNSDDDYYKIMTMPYTGQIGIGWVLYPKWRYIGIDYTTRYFNNPVITPVNTTQFPYAEYLHKNPIEGRSVFMDLLQTRGIRYLIINKDVDNQYISSFRTLFESDDIKKNITFIKNFGNLELYRIAPQMEIPIIYTVKSDSLNVSVTASEKGDYPSLHGDEINNVYPNIAGLETNDVNVTFSIVNPTKYLIKVSNATEPFYLVFSETFHPQWVLYVEPDILVNENNEFSDIIAEYPNLGVNEAKHQKGFTPADIKYIFYNPIKNHLFANGYANAWYVNPNEIDLDDDGNFVLVMYYRPQSYFYIGLIISGLTFIGCMAYLFIDWQKRKLIEGNDAHNN